MIRGYIKFWRKIEDSVSWSRGIEYRGLMSSILIRTSRKKTAFRGTEIQPGQFAAVLSNWCDELNLERTKLKRMLKVLSEDSFISVENVHNRFMLVSVLNWATYQENREGICPTNAQPIPDHRPTDTQPMHNRCTTDDPTNAQPPHNDRPIEQEIKNIRIKKKTEESTSPSGDGSSADVLLVAESNKPKGIPNCPYDSIVEVYNRILPQLPQVKMVTEKRKKVLNAAWRGHEARQSVEWWEAYFKLVLSCPFLLGKKKDWKANFDWLLSPGNMVKVLEGHFREEAQPPATYDGTNQPANGDAPSYNGMKINSVAQGMAVENDALARQMIVNREGAENGNTPAIRTS
ncbi:hypothetical protein [Maridesulfovibrio ferrireducens]|uniref:hypothetical protein n=1 Tax=Maridesulfovibrio ferrireducens TaxID=246191 RepID=UPI001A32EF8E|nr:hypothetical protein [Maridesulfovibrio ferrireducens]MBI9110265.1 hypothetical protein [Maridesulfovibrio ferrireducens]